jgi:acyl carrier protein
MCDVKDKVNQIMSLVFNVKSIPKDYAYGVYESWDSLNHMNLITALEEEFSIRLSDDDVTDMLNVELVQGIISDNLN